MAIERGLLCRSFDVTVAETLFSGGYAGLLLPVVPDATWHSRR